MTTHHRTSSGTSLPNALYGALDDFWRAFGRPPSLILIPGFRRAEIDAYRATYVTGYVPDEFAGIPFKFTDGEVIELL